ncbi:putative RNase H [Lyophyllum shimeji]|uniref:ribonuclease H n=1 Tax=Lyophyllum shimeji TaxID=47721 RepID=A0A9P3UKZ8_LYOSH|nr:putative RNase H [Lyophyllum shimeji]
MSHDAILSPFLLAKDTHPDPDPNYRTLKYEPRLHLIPSYSDQPFDEPETPAELEEIRKVLYRVQHPTFVTIDRKAPLCHPFVPDADKEEVAGLLAKCASTKTPEALFPPQRNRNTIVALRYIHARDSGVLLLQTDGACLNNGQAGPRAGAAFVFGPPNPRRPTETGVCAMSLDSADATNNRAELIAVIMALRARIWWGEGFHTIVVATDSEYVVKGCTERCRNWEARGWKTSNRQPVKNRDLWEELIWGIEFIRHHGCEFEHVGVFEHDDTPQLVTVVGLEATL